MYSRYSTACRLSLALLIQCLLFCSTFDLLYDEVSINNELNTSFYFKTKLHLSNLMSNIRIPKT